MKVKLNKYRKQDIYEQRFLQFHSMNNDPSQMRERFGYMLFREMGVVAPRAVHAKLYINGEFEGLFILVEQIDKRFLRSRFRDRKGNLYKGRWPMFPDRPDYFIEGLKTNEDNPSVVKMLKLSKDILEDPESVMGKWFDTRYVMNYLAVDRMVMHDDGPLHWYCIPTATAPVSRHMEKEGEFPYGVNHNYYFYTEKKADRAWLIAWDLDHIFGRGSFAFNLFMEAPYWAGDPGDCNCSKFAPLSSPPATCDPLIRQWASMEEEYQSAIARVLDGPWSRIVSRLAVWREQIADATREAAMDPEQLQEEEWEAALAVLRQQIDEQENLFSELVR